MRSGSALIVVAHPDDETLWAGGTMLMNPQVAWTIVTLCRGSDADRAPKFLRALQEFKAAGMMGDLDDGPAQRPLEEAEVQEAVLTLVGQKRSFDLILTHSPYGEYRRHRRHEETGRAVVALWGKGRLRAANLWLFAYADRNRRRLPRAIPKAHERVKLPRKIRRWKYRIITELYGFPEGGFEARSTPGEEAFWCFQDKDELGKWMKRKATMHESVDDV